MQNFLGQFQTVSVYNYCSYQNILWLWSKIHSHKVFKWFIFLTCKTSHLSQITQELSRGNPENIILSWYRKYFPNIQMALKWLSWNVKKLSTKSLLVSLLKKKWAQGLQPVIQKGAKKVLVIYEPTLGLHLRELHQLTTIINPHYSNDYNYKKQQGIQRDLPMRYMPIQSPASTSSFISQYITRSCECPME